MNEKIKVGITTTIVLLTLFLCGCTDIESLSQKVVNTEFLGIWNGNMKYIPDINYSEYDLIENSNHTNISDFQKFVSANITKLDFKEEEVVITIETENDTITMSNSYSVEGNILHLSIDLKGQRPGGMQPPEEREIPLDWERSKDGQFPIRGERPSRTTTYIYSFNGDKTILYLDENPFYKIYI